MQREWGHSARPPAPWMFPLACTKSRLHTFYPPTSGHTTQILHNTSGLRAQREGLPVRDECQEVGNCQPRGRSGQQRQLGSGPVRGQQSAAEESDSNSDVRDLRQPGVGQSQRPDRHHQAVRVPDGHHHRPDSGTYIWDYSQDTCPDMLVSLYRGWIKVLTNSTATFTDGTAIVSGRDKNQVAGLELKETMILCGRAAQTTHTENIAVFFHPWSRSRWRRASSTW